MRFIAVAIAPNQAAINTGCALISYPAGIVRPAVEKIIWVISGSPRYNFDPVSMAGVIELQLSPKYIQGSITINPATGPAAPISKSAFLDVIGDLILIKAPIVPKREGKGMK